MKVELGGDKGAETESRDRGGRRDGKAADASDLPPRAPPSRRRHPARLRPR
jgi:hypothetical protein